MEASPEPNLSIQPTFYYLHVILLPQNLPPHNLEEHGDGTKQQQDCVVMLPPVIQDDNTHVMNS